MTRSLRRWLFPIGIFVFTCFGVFVVPFLFPPPVLQGVSSANTAGFNNKIAAVVAACLSLIVFLMHLRWRSPATKEQAGDYSPLSPRFVVTVCAIYGAILIALTRLVLIAHERFLADAGYFIEQIGSHADYGRKLYDQIEFPYGPLLFYGPILTRSLLSPFHVSLSGAYYTTLVLEQILGLLFVAYVINSLPMLRRWRILAFVLCAMVAVELCLGLNYTFFRFGLSAAFIVLSAKQRRPLTATVSLFAGQVLSLAVSPEMGFAFGASGTAYAAYKVFSGGRRWTTTAVTPCVATFVFLIFAGGGYLRMLKLFAHGVYNFVIEPRPYIIVFLIALVWLVPSNLAVWFREHRAEFPHILALYVLTLALLPVAFGRADPGHVIFNGFVVLLLSMAAISHYRRSAQVLWAACVAAVFVFGTYLDTVPFEFDVRSAIHYDILHYGSNGLKHAAYEFTKMISPAAAEHYMSATQEADAQFDMSKLQATIGGSKLSTPYLIPLQLENALKRSGQYTPAFYCFRYAVLDANAEQREIVDFNQSEWALIPKGASLRMVEPAPAKDPIFGIRYPAKRSPYVVGVRFDENLERNWTAIADVDGFEIYRRHTQLISGN